MRNNRNSLINSAVKPLFHLQLDFIRGFDSADKETIARIFP